MKYNFDTSRLGMLVFLGMVLAALWLVAAYGFYKESERAKYDVEISPGAVTYGTHSTALMPVSVAPMQHSLPMLSGGEIRSSAHGGHASSPAVTNQGQLHTTSSATVKNVGSGMGYSGSYAITTTSSHRADRGINYSVGTTTLPSIAMLSTSSMTNSVKTPRSVLGFRKAKPSGTGSDGEYRDGGEGDLWTWDGEKWVLVNVGDSRLEGGQRYYWNGTIWVPASEWEPETPVGPMPWLLMLLLAVGYGISKRRQHLLNT